MLISKEGLDKYFHANQIDYFTNDNGEILVNRIGKYENYEKDLKIIFEEIGFSIHEIPHLNPTNIKNYKNYFTEKSIELVRKYCHKDINYFGYHF